MRAETLSLYSKTILFKTGFLIEHFGQQNIIRQLADR